MSMKFYENPSSGSRIVPCGQTDGSRHEARSTVAFHNFSNAPTDC